MAQISYIKYTDVLEARRYDAEYFKPEYLEIEKKILKLNNRPIGKIISLLTDYHANGSYQTLNEHVKLLDKKDYALMIRTVDFETDDYETNSKYLSESSYNFLEKTKMFGGEIVINKIGNAGRVYFLQNLDRPVSLGMNQFMIKTSENINNYYLYIYLISYYGKKLLERRITGAVPLSIDKQSVKNVIVPILPQSFQLQIEQIVKSSHQKQTGAKQLYREAGQLLLAELGLLYYQVKHSLWFTTTKNEVSEAHRYDSEYFQPKYAEIIKRIEKYDGGWDFAGEIVKWKKGVEVGTEAYTETGKDFVRVSDFSIYGTSESNRKISDEAFERLKKNYQPKQGEILFTKDGTIGLSYVLKEDIQGVLSGAFLRLTLKEKYKNFEKECLSLIFSSILCKMQVEKLSGGALIAHLKPSDFETFKIPLIKQSVQKQIAEKIQESYRLRKESKNLLEEAKRKIEEEIEK